MPEVPAANADTLSPFHCGEQHVQRRAGVRDRTEDVGERPGLRRYARCSQEFKFCSSSPSGPAHAQAIHNETNGYAAFTLHDRWRMCLCT
jgi:hypothetical protein